TDARSGSVVWNNWIQLQKSNSFGTHEVKAAALSGTVTVFIEAKIGANCTLRESNGSPINGNIVWIDAAILVPDNSVQPVAPPSPTPVPPTSTPVAPPTATRLPATATSTRASLTSTPIVPTATAATVTVATATATLVSTATATSSPTLEPTTVPTTAPVAIAINPSSKRPTATATSPAALALDTGSSTMTMGLLGASGCSLLMAFAFGGIAYWIWRRK
ncbi:MAG: hypothetical protein LC737_09505, partial [Chloroflexi bacterium]|nr:hypothetical protein [Chloroflexota bacterium]